MNLRDAVVVILAAVLTGLLFWALCGKAAWFIGHDDGRAYERYMESMMENGMYPDIYGDGWGGATMKTWKVILTIAVIMTLFFALQFWAVANYGLDGGGNMMFMG